MLWCYCCSLNSSQIASLQNGVFAQIAPKKCIICRTAENYQIRYQKGAGTKMQKCLVWPWNTIMQLSFLFSPLLKKRKAITKTVLESILSINVVTLIFANRKYMKLIWSFDQVWMMQFLVQSYGRCN
jgi:hypothetical protein